MTGGDRAGILSDRSRLQWGSERRFTCRGCGQSMLGQAGSFYPWFSQNGDWVAAVLLALAAAACAVPAVRRIVSVIARPVARLARRRDVAILTVGLVAFLFNAFWSLAVKMPLPSVHDEFSYLLAADTFAQGRLTNPSPAMPEHFESFHVLVEPTYMTKYPPGQGLFLALGQVMTGMPIFGAWLAVSLASAAICWMLYAWTRPSWALLGGLLAAFHPLLFAWAQNYWGGGVAALGGALLLCGLKRLLDRPSWKDGLWAALGIALLAVSRPYEGLILTLLVGAAFLFQVLRSPGPKLPYFRAAMIPLLAIMLPVFAWMGYYNYRITGNALTLPYQLHDRIYAQAPTFIFADPWPQREYRHEELRWYYQVQEMADYRRHYDDFWGTIYSKLRDVLVAGYFNPWLLAVPLLALPVALWRSRQVRLATLLLALFVAGMMLAKLTYAHYAAPAAGLFFFLLIASLRHLRVLLRRRRIGQITAQAVVLSTAAYLVLFYFAKAGEPIEGLAPARAAYQAQLQAQPGKHLVVVRYVEPHEVSAEWVYNVADFDDAPVLWARDLGSESNRRLIETYGDRQPWLLTTSQYRAEIVPYPATE